jgi:hypothetical protein
MKMTALLASPARQPVALLVDRAQLALMLLKREGKEVTQPPLRYGVTPEERDSNLVRTAMEEFGEPFPRWGINE